MNRTKVNKEARQRIAEIAERDGLTRCEAKLKPCWGEAHAPAHRHKRSWYYDKPDSMLSDKNQWIACCQPCHNLMEFDDELTKRVFIATRGIES